MIGVANGCASRNNEPRKKLGSRQRYELRTELRNLIRERAASRERSRGWPEVEGSEL
jgi:hypothetical protein